MDLPLGQGKPLPPDFPYVGEWLIENIVFLYDDAPPRSGAGPRFSAICPNAKGGSCIGFFVAHLAAALGVSIAHVFDANRDGSLKFLGTEAAATIGGGGPEPA